MHLKVIGSLLLSGVLGAASIASAQPGRPSAAAGEAATAATNAKAFAEKASGAAAAAIEAARQAQVAAIVAGGGAPPLLAGNALAPSDYCRNPNAWKRKGKPAKDATDVEQQASQGLGCCIDPQRNATPADHFAAVTCIDDKVYMLAAAHAAQARGRQQFFFGETAASATGGGALVIGGAKAAANTTVAWSIVALAPAVIEDITAAGPRSQVHHGAANAFSSLHQHYSEMERHFGNLAAIDTENDALTLQCAGLKSLKTVPDDAAAPSGADVLNDEIKRFTAYCSENTAAVQSLRPYRDALLAAYEDVPGKYAQDAQAIEGTFHKISFGLQAAPSQALQIMLAAPFDALANAIHSGKTVNDYKARQATFDLEKDGLALASVWPDVAAPDKPLPIADIDLAAAAAKLEPKLGGDEAKAGYKRLHAIADASTAVLESNRRANRAVAALHAGSGTYKMVFDFRAAKRTADVEFTKGGVAK